MMTPYDPFVHAEQLGITVIYRPIQREAMLLADFDTIVIRSGTCPSRVRFLLAHKLVHVMLNQPAPTDAECDNADHIARARLLVSTEERPPRLRPLAPAHRLSALTAQLAQLSGERLGAAGVLLVLASLLIGSTSDGVLL